MRANDRALGLAWGAAAAAAAGLAPLAARAAELLPPCLFRSVTGLPCPTCGSTRAVLALARLDLAGAVALNPLAVAAAIVFVAGGLIAAIAALGGRPLREPQRYPPAARLALLAAVAANWVWLLAAARGG
ncbi:MAG: DUF2752 domain-containing protein [Acidobacteriota bacterium]